MRVRPAIAVTALLAVPLAGCSLGRRQALTDNVTNAAKATASGVTSATLAVRVTTLKSKVPVAPGPPRIVNASAADLTALLDFGTDRAAVAAPGGKLAAINDAALIFAGTKAFERHDIKVASASVVAIDPSKPPDQQAAAASAVAPSLSNLPVLAAANKLSETAPPPAGATPPTTAPPNGPGGSRLRRPVQIQRRWLAFDYADLPTHVNTRIAGSFAISPIALVRLAQGPLAGSIEELGHESINGAAETHYKMKVSRSKAERRLPEDVRKQLDKIFHANAIGGDVFNAEAWVDQSGRLAQFDVTFRQSLSRIDRADLLVSLTLHGAAPAGTSLSAPDPDTVATVNQLGQLVHGAAGS